MRAEECSFAHPINSQVDSELISISNRKGSNRIAQKKYTIIPPAQSLQPKLRNFFPFLRPKDCKKYPTYYVKWRTMACPNYKKYFMQTFFHDQHAWKGEEDQGTQSWPLLSGVITSSGRLASSLAAGHTFELWWLLFKNLGLKTKPFHLVCDKKAMTNYCDV